MEDTEIIRRRLRLREEVINRVREFARSLPFRCSVFLVGSYARGDFNAWSDVDVVVVGDFVGDPLRRLMSIDAPPGFEVIPLTREELLTKVRRRDPLAMDLIEHGVGVRDDLGLCGELGLAGCLE